MISTSEVVERWIGFWISYQICDRSINKYIKKYNQENATVSKREVEKLFKEVQTTGCFEGEKKNVFSK